MLQTNLISLWWIEICFTKCYRGGKFLGFELMAKPNRKVKEYIWRLFQMKKRRNLAYVSASHTHMINWLSFEESMRHGANNRVSVISMKSLNLPPMHISLQKLCGPVCAQWVYVFKRYHNTIGPSPTSTFPFSEVAIIHIDMTML